MTTPTNGSTVELTDVQLISTMMQPATYSSPPVSSFQLDGSGSAGVESGTRDGHEHHRRRGRLPHDPDPPIWRRFLLPGVTGFVTQIWGFCALLMDLIES